MTANAFKWKLTDDISDKYVSDGIVYQFLTFS